MLETLLSNRTVSVLWEALPRILSAGLTMTIPLTLVSFTLAMVLAVAVALRQYARVPVLSQLARFYIWGHPRHAAAGAAFHHLLRPAQRGHHAGRFPGGSHRLRLQRGCILR